MIRHEKLMKMNTRKQNERHQYITSLCSHKFSSESIIDEEGRLPLVPSFDTKRTHMNTQTHTHNTHTNTLPIQKQKKKTLKYPTQNTCLHVFFLFQHCNAIHPFHLRSVDWWWLHIASNAFQFQFQIVHTVRVYW